MGFIRYATIGLTAFYGFVANAIDLPEHSPSPGGVAIIDLGPHEAALPEVYYHKRRVSVVQDGDRWKAIVGIPLSAKPGSDSITDKTSQQTYDFDIIDRYYPEQRLTIKNKRKVNPNPDDTRRIQQESPLKRNAKRHYSTDRIPDFSMALPVKGPYSSHFGLKRFFNDQPRRPHGGLDIAVPRHTPIYAPADGKVLEAQDFFFSGNCIFLDHGRGLISLYAHMTDIKVKKGDIVKEGDLIGTVGDTGRVTGPHLHWSVGLNGTWVDPALFLSPEDRPPELDKTAP